MVPVRIIPGTRYLVLVCIIPGKYHTAVYTEGNSRRTFLLITRLYSQLPFFNFFSTMLVGFLHASSRYDTWCKYFASNRLLKSKFSSISSTPSIHADYSSEILRSTRSMITEPRHTHSCDTVYQVHNSNSNVVIFWTMTSIHVV